MSYLKERFNMPNYVELFAPRPLERADSLREGWVCFYKMTFKIRLRLLLHHIINMVLNFYNIAPRQLMPNSWRYLLWLIVLSEECGLHIDMATFLYFFYMKSSEEGRYTLYARRQIRLFEDAPTSDKGWKDCYFFVKREGLFGLIGTFELGIRSTWTKRALNFSERLRTTAEQKNMIQALLKTKTKSLLTIPEGILLPILEVPYLHVLEGCIRLLYGVPTDPLWASYLAADMGKLKMKISKAELEATKKKKKDKQAAMKGGASTQTDRGEELEDSSTIRSDTTFFGPIVDSLMTNHDRSVLKEMTLDEIGLEAEQSTLKVTNPILTFLRAFILPNANSRSVLQLAHDAQYLYNAVIKVDKVFKKKAKAYNSIMVANKTLEEDNLALKQTAVEAAKRAEQLERKWSEADLKLIEKDKELEALRLDYAKVAGERDAFVIEKNEQQARVAR
ncbi:hypothetical protein FNV43_RR00038 [Rhamnella rubrinervis]|uniref:Transposase (putative) gypsy type domain-containing protein n=1 Tax=Rhamnella rubrinervis TaxID=2594499 RepID=A0A8K0HPT6_9ROSA|nr:hypothetical protein FNV43_RR00038 [Rhamnella rubrinervis]